MKVIAIDGPVGVGKSAVAAGVAAQLGITHLDTGAMYRAVCWQGLQEGRADPLDPPKLTAIAKNLSIRWDANNRLYAGETDITEAIRGEAISALVSKIASIQGVREAMVAQQRAIGSQQPSVLEGRDIGTVVFPNAGWKFFLDAAPEVRARRRIGQLREKGEEADFSTVLASLRERDERDRNREWGALRLAPDAVVIDTTRFTLTEVIETICNLAAPINKMPETVS